MMQFYQQQDQPIHDPRVNFQFQKHPNPFHHEAGAVLNNDHSFGGLHGQQQTPDKDKHMSYPSGEILTS